MNIFGVSQAFAAAAAPAAGQSHGSFLSMLPMLVIFVAVFYFLLVRPQSKRAKEQKALMSNVALGDEVMTVAGIVGKVIKLRDNFIVVEIADNTQVTMQKNAISSILPKGTIAQAEQGTASAVQAEDPKE